MSSLLLFVLALAAASAAPQYLWPYGAFVVKDAANYEAMKVMRGLVPVPVSSDYYYVSVPVQEGSRQLQEESKPVQGDLLVPVAVQDTDRGLVQPVQDTLEVKEAKALFKIQYEKAAIAAAVAPERRRRAVSDAATPAATSRLNRQLPVPVILSEPAAYWPHAVFHHTPYVHPAHAPLFL